MNENVGEQKLNCPLYEGPSEPSVRNSKAGANEFTINNYPDPRIKYNFRFQNADGSFCRRDDMHVLDSGFFSL